MATLTLAKKNPLSLFRGVCWNRIVIDQSCLFTLPTALSYALRLLPAPAFPSGWMEAIAQVSDMIVADEALVINGDLDLADHSSNDHGDLDIADHSSNDHGDPDVADHFSNDYGDLDIADHCNNDHGSNSNADEDSDFDVIDNSDNESASDLDIDDYSENESDVDKDSNSDNKSEEAQEEDDGELGPIDELERTGTVPCLSRCGKIFDTYAQAFRHYKKFCPISRQQNIPGALHACPYPSCTLKFTWIKLSKHLQQRVFVHEPTTFICRMCGLYFPDRYRQGMHETWHCKMTRNQRAVKAGQRKQKPPKQLLKPKPNLHFPVFLQVNLSPTIGSSPIILFARASNHFPKAQKMAVRAYLDGHPEFLHQ
ncbi:hypothetical protein K491DRAFT_368848 [Lophiostoma macrostomum CBS 122681]|uniref:C2H2-type domain-containing protein n=1 Tax=Lophiostoma macrostomum CBS 122681 TaxID=1314788 RepID=A0A6A6TAC0_9PLEO|nr:hypothetical protein K491DRAFT_368848 [Lophiostoma macrostomum CBS 122681]